MRPGRVQAAYLTTLSIGMQQLGNRSFAGVYEKGRVYAEAFPHFLSGASDTHLILCHPAVSEPIRSPFDDMGAQRLEQYDYLMSVQFEEDMQRLGFRLARFSDSPAMPHHMAR